MIKTRERESTQGERAPAEHSSGTNAMPEFRGGEGFRRTDGQSRDKEHFGRPIFAPAHLFVCTFQIACSIIRASRRANTKRTTREWVEDGLCDEPDFDSWAHPRSRKGRTAWHSDAFALGLIGHGIRANKHRAGGRLGVGMQAVSNGSRGAQ